MVDTLSAQGFLTKVKKVPAKSRWHMRWFGYGLVDVVRQDGSLDNSVGEEFFVTTTGLDGIADLLRDLGLFDSLQIVY